MKNVYDKNNTNNKNNIACRSENRNNSEISVVVENFTDCFCFVLWHTNSLINFQLPFNFF